MIINLATVMAILLLQGWDGLATRLGGKQPYWEGTGEDLSLHGIFEDANGKGKYVNEVEGKETARIGENMEESLSGKDPSLGYRVTIFPHKAKYGTKAEYGGKIMPNDISGKMASSESMEDAASYELKGKNRIEVRGKETARVKGKIAEDSQPVEEPSLGFPFTIFPRMLKGKYGGKDMVEQGGKIMANDVTGKITDSEFMMEDAAAGKLKEKYGGKNMVEQGGKIMANDLTGKITDSEFMMEDAATGKLKGKFEGKENEEFGVKLMVNDIQEYIQEDLEKAPVYETKSEQPLGANVDFCIKFFFSVQELPHYFAGVTDAILSATRKSVPLVEKLVNCTKRTSFMDILACIRAMEPELRDYYISELPLLKQPVLAFHDQFIKIKNELEGCLVIRKSDKETISFN